MNELGMTQDQTVEWNKFQSNLIKELTETNHNLSDENERLRAVLHQISLGSQNSSETKESLGRAARVALGESDD